MIEIAIGLVTVGLAILLAVLIRRRLERRRRLSSVLFCENCGKRIHTKERTWQWHGAQVCLDCRKRLGELGQE